MAMQHYAPDDLRSGIPEHLPECTSPRRERLMPAASLTSDLVERGKTRPGLSFGLSPVQYPVLVEPQNQQIEVVKPGLIPVEAEVESAVTAFSENIWAVAAEETVDGELVAMAPTDKWFNMFRNAIFFIVVFWVGAYVATTMTY